MTQTNSVRPPRRLLRAMRVRAEEYHAKEPAYVRAMNWQTVLALVVAVLAALAIRQYGFEIIRVEGPSMEPTLYTDERVFVEKVSYVTHPPERGDIIVCRYDPQIYNKPVIKRIVGLPGETVSIVDGQFYINGSPIDESAYYQGVMLEDMAPVTVPARMVFVAGDNRDWSLDSRMVGCIPYEKMRGKARFFMWPFEKLGQPIDQWIYVVD